MSKDHSSSNQAHSTYDDVFSQVVGHYKKDSNETYVLYVFQISLIVWIRVVYSCSLAFWEDQLPHSMAR